MKRAFNLPNSEFIPGLTTYFSIIYLLIVIPHILSQAGITYSTAFMSVCLLAAVASICSGLYARTPIVYAPGLGLLSYFTFVIVGEQGMPWQKALAAVFIANLLLIFISITPIRKWILEAIPSSLSGAIAAGIGFFLGMLALHSVGVIHASATTLVQLGNLHSLQTLLFVLGFFVIVILDVRKVPGAILWGMLLISVLDWIITNNHFKGILALPQFNVQTWGQLNFDGFFSSHSLMTCFTFFLIGLFDSTGSIIGLLKTIPDEALSTRKITRSLLVESCSSSLGAVMGLTTCSPLLESGAGIRAGARTGKSAFWVGIFLLASLFLGPFAESIPTVAIASALFYVACLMITPLAEVKWDQITEMVPAVVTLFTIPLTFSISDGVGMGVITFVLLNLSYGRWKEVKPGLYLIALTFIVYFCTLH